MISQRTKAALAEAKRRGTRLGNPRIEAARTLALAAHHAHRPEPEVLTLMVEWRSQGKTLRAIARDLNRLNIRPARAANGTPAASGASFWPTDSKSPALRRG